jgi:hypothetical protein
MYFNANFITLSVFFTSIKLGKYVINKSFFVKFC